MNRTIGVMGSESEPVADEARQRLVELGRAIAERDCILITGSSGYLQVDFSETSG